MSQPIVLVSHLLCPYVQRAAIVLLEKGVPFERRNIDLANKPDWFLAISPLGKVPILQVGKTAIFESAVICEYLDETLPPPLHPPHPLQRAQHRGWMELGSAILADIASFYSAKDEATLEQKALQLQHKFAQINAVLGEGPYFAGKQFTLVDAVFAPIFRYLDAFDAIADFGLLAQSPAVQAWRQALAQRPSVQRAVVIEYPQLLNAFLSSRNSALSLHMQEHTPRFS
ncbi:MULTISPECIES: glutathione S-transferase family protein [Deefgea]|uniref:glutathione transferase n=1 Tax=Deefgea chitinilytica TaxID=570276 RepID=A0ABS2CAF9_9NEIS|nr:MULTISPECIES: glutathione S-transferase family protein [Deefgea]MBM5571134.1 glutathione S-transferase family protein [Deefgea chitinilytica]MBM9888364.1 glutathione S-transferase family protein [Deefgea sp. CFH1-16]